MDRTTMTYVTADVRLSETLDALYVVPQDPADALTILRRLSASMPTAGLRRGAGGIRVGRENATYLKIGTPGLNLVWASEARQFVANRERVAAAYPAVRASIEGIKAGGPDAARLFIKDSDGLNVLDRHQVTNVAAMTVPEGFGLCVFDEQGAGKTVTMIYAFDLMVARDEVDLLVIVAPKSMVAEWPKDFATFRGDLYRVAILTGTSVQKRSTLRSGADVLVMNFETAVALEAELKSLLRNKDGRAVLAIDESFFIKSLDAKRTRALRRLREWCGRAYVLCGTPAPNAPQDLVQQFSLVDFGLAFEGLELPKDRETAMPLVQEVVDTRGLYIRHLKTDVLPDLPQKQFQRIYVPMEPRQRRLYEGALNRLVDDAEAASDRDFQKTYANFLARRAALLQVCSNPQGIDPSYKETPSKLATMDNILHELVEQRGEKVVVWSFYTASVTALVERYARYGTLRYDGQVSNITERREAVRRFQQDADAKILVANPAAAGAGLTLHSARIAIYESLSNQAAHYLQSLDRIHRRGQTRDVEYLVLLCDGTIEVQEYDRLIRKERAAQDLLGDQVSAPVTRESFLADARAAVEFLSRSQ